MPPLVEAIGSEVLDGSVAPTLVFLPNLAAARRSVFRFRTNFG